MAKLNCPYVQIRIESEAPEFCSAEISPELFSSFEWVTASAAERAGFLAIIQAALSMAHKGGHFEYCRGYLEQLGTLFSQSNDVSVDMFEHWECWIDQDD